MANVTENLAKSVRSEIKRLHAGGHNSYDQHIKWLETLSRQLDAAGNTESNALSYQDGTLRTQQPDAAAKAEKNSNERQE